MSYQGLINNSLTYDFGAVLIIAGAIQTYLPALELPQPYNGIATMVIGVIVAYLRYKTTGPVGDKP